MACNRSTVSALAFTLWTALLKHNKVSSITVFNFLIPVSGTILSALLLGDSILGQAVTVMLYRENPDLDEGELASDVVRVDLTHTHEGLAAVCGTVARGDERHTTG